VSFRSVQLSSNKSSAQSRSLDSQFDSSRVSKSPFSRQSVRFRSSVQVAVLSTISSIQVECPSRRSLDSRFNSGRVSKSPFSRQSVQFRSSARSRSLDNRFNSSRVSKSPFSRQSRIRQLYRRRFNIVRVGCPLAVLPTSRSSAAVSSLCTLGFLKTIRIR
jgi:hypothetical protein